MTLTEQLDADDALMAAAAHGDARAFVELVKRHEVRVRSFIACVLGDRTLAKDLTQQVFLQLWESRRRYRANGRFREWVFTIAKNVCRSQQRRAWVRGLFGAAPNETQTRAEEGTEAKLLRAEANAQVQHALRQVPEHFRVPLTLRFVEGLEYDEIARIIGRTASATRSRIHYGLKALAEQLPSNFTAGGLP